MEQQTTENCGQNLSISGQRGNIKNKFDHPLDKKR